MRFFFGPYAAPGDRAGGVGGGAQDGVGEADELVNALDDAKAMLTPKEISAIFKDVGFNGELNCPVKRAKVERLVAAGQAVLS